MGNCNRCGIYIPNKHFNQRYCSKCKIIVRHEIKVAYKHSKKGMKSELRWRKSKRRKSNEKKYRAKPRAKHLAVLRAKKYLKKHPLARLKKNECDKNYAKTSKGKLVRNKASRRYRHTEKGKQMHRNYKARKRQVSGEGKLTIEEWYEILHKYHHRCARCGKKCKLEQDHIIPLSKGGKHNKQNIQPLCRRCNSSKGNKLEEEKCIAHIVEKK